MNKFVMLLTCLYILTTPVLASNIVVTVDKSKQLATVVVDDHVRYEWPVIAAEDVDTGKDDQHEAEYSNTPTIPIIMIAPVSSEPTEQK